MRKTVKWMTAAVLLALINAAYGTATFVDTTNDHMYANNSNWLIPADKTKHVDIQGDPAIGAVITEYGPVASTTPDCNNLTVGYNGVTARLELAPGSRLRSTNIYVGVDYTSGPGVGTVEVYGQLASRGGPLGIGHAWGTGMGGTGTVNVHSGGSVIVNAASGRLELGSNDASGLSSLGTLTINTGGTVNVGGGLTHLGFDAGGTGIMNIFGGTFLSSVAGNLAFDVGLSGHGEVNMTGGTFDLGLGRLNLSHNVGSTGHVQLDGGIMTIGDIWEWDGDGSMDIAGGELIIPNTKAGRINTFIGDGIITGFGNVGPGWFNISDDGVLLHITAVPEPASLTLLAAALMLVRRRR